MPEAAALDPSVVIAAAGGIFVLMLLSSVTLTAVYVVRPRMRLKRRMTDLGLVGGGKARAGGAGGGGNPRQKRIQEKLQELEEKKSQKKSRRNQIRADLMQAGIDMNVRNYLMVTGIVGLAAAAVAMVLGIPVVAALFIGLIAAFGLPKLALRFMARSRRKKFTQNFANAVDVIVRGIKTGLPVGECLSVIGREAPEPVGQEFRLLVEGQKIGLGLEELLRRGLERMPTPEFKFFAIVLQIQQQTGGNLAATLSNLSEVLRERKKMKDKVQSLSSEAKSSAMIIGALPFLVSGGMYGMNPDYMSLLFTETVGNYLLVAGLCWMGIGVSVMTKMIHFDI